MQRLVVQGGPIGRGLDPAAALSTWRWSVSDHQNREQRGEIRRKPEQGLVGQRADSALCLDALLRVEAGHSRGLCEGEGRQNLGAARVGRCLNHESLEASPCQPNFHLRRLVAGKQAHCHTSAGVDAPQYDFGSPNTRSAMWLRISSRLTGAMRGIMLSRK